MTFSSEQITDQFIEEVLPLLRKHYDEVSHFRDIPLEPDFEAYKRCNETGLLRLFVVRDDDKRVIGYAAFFVKESMHRKHSKQAAGDVIFIDKAHRGRGKEFIKFCDEQLAADGCDVVYHHVKASHNFGKMLERMGYELIDLSYARRLKHG